MLLNGEWLAACWFGFLRLRQECRIGANQSSNIDPPPPPLLTGTEKANHCLLSLWNEREKPWEIEVGESIVSFKICSNRKVFYRCLSNQHGLAVGTTGAGCRLSVSRWPQDLRRSGGAGRAPIGWALLGGGLWLAEQQGGQQMKGVKTDSNNNCRTWARLPHTR